MNIRTITVGTREDQIGQAVAAAQRARTLLQEAGYTIQTLRLALTMVGSNRCGNFSTIVRGAEELALSNGFDMVSIGRVELERVPDLAEALLATEQVSACIRIAGRSGEIDYHAIRLAAEAMLALAQQSPHGFGNFRLAALAAVAQGSPFFPGSYHDGGGAWLAVGPEAAALALEATLTQGHTTPQAMMQALTGLIEQHDRRIRGAINGLTREYGVFATGCDWSLAPSAQVSIGAAIEAMSGVRFGAWGTLAAVRMLTEAIRAAQVDRVGFSGVMLPVLEDAILARRSLEQCYSLRDLLAFSAVCGTGLDTIPLPGDTTVEQLAAILLEVGALAGALRKPLTARLMPMPGRKAGETTTIHAGADPQIAPFLCDARVFEVI